MSPAKKQKAPRRHCVRFRPDPNGGPPPDIPDFEEEEPDDTGFTLVDIPEDMTHSYRLVKNPFDATGPLPMFEHVFELKPAGGDKEDHKMTKSNGKHRRRPVEAKKDTHYGASRSPEHVSPSVVVSPPEITGESGLFVHRGSENRRPPPGPITMPEPLFDPAGLARDGLDSRSPYGFVAPAIDSRLRSHSPIGAPFAYMSSRRTSLSAQTDVSSSRGPSPSTSSSQDSALSVEHAGTLRPLGLFDRAVLLDNVHLVYPEDNMAGLPHGLHSAPLPQLPSFNMHQHHYLPSQFPARHPAALSCPDFQSMQNVFSLSHPFQPGFPSSGRHDMYSDRTAYSGFSEATSTHSMHDSFAHSPFLAGPTPGSLHHNRLGQTGNSLLYSIAPSHDAGPVNHSSPRDFHGCHPPLVPAARPHSAAGRYDHHLSLPTLPPPLRAPTPNRTMDTQPLDPRHAFVPRPVAQSVRFIPVAQPAPPPAPRAAPLSLPPPAPFEPELGYPPLEAAKTLSWTTHFDALGRRGKKKTRSRKLKAGLPPAGCDHVGNPVFYQCPLCPRHFQRRNGLAIHMKWHYKERDGDGEALHFWGSGID